MTPLIGITPNIIRHEAWAPLQYGQNDTYVNAILTTGGLPVIVPLTDDHTLLRALYRRLDGLLLAGGEDISATPSLRDRTEIQLTRWALQDHKPLFGTCRGLQIMNHVAGGTLHPDISTSFPDALDHSQSEAAHNIAHVAHQIKIDPASQLYHHVRTETLGINEYHHQAIDKLGGGFKATAWTADGIIEAIERPGYRFCIGVQCHPESLVTQGTEPGWRPLFEAFVTSAMRH
jgi:putative glutamine amidotransferase